MRNYFLLTLILLSTHLLSISQTINKAASDAFTITRMVEKFHVQPRPVNRELSANWFDEILKSLDDAKIFFTREDISRLLPYRSQLDAEVAQQKTGFLQLLISIYQQRVQQVDTMTDNICKTPFNFNLNETFTAQEDSSYPLNPTLQHVKLYKHFKSAVLDALLEVNEEFNVTNPAQLKKINDSLEIVFRKKVKLSVKHFIEKMLQSPGGLPGAVGNEYCKALALCFDPHTEFFPPTEKENFETQLGNKPLRLGFRLGEAEDGSTTIDNLKPGSPAFKSGQLNKGDKIQSIQWEGKEPIDVSEASPAQVSSILDASNHDKVTITIKKADGSIRKVELRKERDETEDAEESKVKSFLLKGTKTIGFISLPDFYIDWENNEKGLNGCANDVAREILKLRKENIDGLILDIRFNGGGSMTEATELAGIFIDAGPVAQLKTKDPKVLTLKDPARGTIYDGPLMIMVNGYSASASEMLAGTLQDYNRAVIIGSPTYGKATAQIVLPLDTTISLETDNHNKQADSYIKLTTDKLYRVNGTTAQFKGVQPDIFLPDVLEANATKESDNLFALRAAPIDANKYYKPYAALSLSGLQAAAKTMVDTGSFFKTVKEYVVQAKKLQQPRNFPLRWTDALQERKKQSAITKDIPETDAFAKAPFTIQNHSFEEQQLKTDSDLREMNASWKERLLGDPYLQTAYTLMLMMIK